MARMILAGHMMHPHSKNERARIFMRDNSTVIINETDDETIDESIWGNSPYAAGDSEFEPVWEKYHRLVYWEAEKVSARLGKKTDRDFVEDTAQDIFLAVIRCVEKYKRQRFIVSCHGFFIEHPEILKGMHVSRVFTSLWYWRMRSNLGPHHGFRPVHDQYLVDSITDAPPDFMHADGGECLAWIEANATTMRRGLNGSAHMIDDFATAVRGRNSAARLKAGSFLKEHALKFNSFGCKPCRFAPFVHDDEFGPYVKRFVINAGNKIIKRRNPADLIGFVSIDEFADTIPDRRKSTHNPMYSDQMEHMTRRVKSEDDISLGRVFATISDGECNGSIYQGKINSKALHRMLAIPQEEIAAHIGKLKKIAYEAGGVNNPASPVDVLEWLCCRRSAQDTVD
jgi:hypothetical protein